MQVLVDGRSVYQPSIGGVRWDTLPLAMADIDRIEVVRGPNAASFGANALTGVINIITRHPVEVEGRMLSATVGAQNHQDYLFRWAGGESSKHRVTLGWRQDAGFRDLNDTARAPLLNYYGDYDIGPGQGLSLQAGYVGGTRGAGSDNPEINNGLSMSHNERVDSHYEQLDYRRDLGNGQELLAKTYHNFLSGQETVPVDNPLVVPGTTYERDLKSERWHGEVQWNLPLSETLRTTLGGFSRRDAVNSLMYFNRGDDLVNWSWGAFAHAEWRLAPQWLLNAGAMWEDYGLVGPRTSPRASLTWQPDVHHSLRFGISRAYRNPVEAEKNANWQWTLPLVNGKTYTIVKLASNSGIRPESNLSQEIGYLGSWPEHGLSLDARIYHDNLHDLIDIPPGANYFANIGESVHKGVDGQLRWRFGPHSFVLLNYAYLHIDSNFASQHYFPPHTLGLLLSYRLPREVDVSLGHYRNDAFKPIGSNLPPAYRRTDARIAREFRMEGKQARLALIIQHADGADYEYDNVPNKLVSRQGYVQFQLDF